MFDIGFAELLVIGSVALLVLGPDKLPVAVRTCASWVARVRRTLGSIQREINEELRVDEMRRAATAGKSRLDEELSGARTAFGFDEQDQRESESIKERSSENAPRSETGPSGEPARDKADRERAG